MSGFMMSPITYAPTLAVVRFSPVAERMPVVTSVARLVVVENVMDTQQLLSRYWGSIRLEYLGKSSIVERQTASINTDIFLAAAKELGLDITYLVNEKYPLIDIHVKDKTLRVFENITSLNDTASARIADNKWLANFILSKTSNLPLPKASRYKFTDHKSTESLVDKIYNFILSVGGTVVIKPNKGSLGRGVFTNIKVREDVNRAVREIQRIGKTDIIVEGMLFGDDYRFLCYRGEIVEVVKRIPAHIIGDGHSTIRQLIEEKNSMRSSMQIKPIKMDTSVEQNLKKQDLSLDSVINEQQRIVLKDACNLALGGEVAAVSIKDVHLDYQQLCDSVWKTSGLDLTGIDIMATDLSLPISSSSTGINEINAAPMIEVSYYGHLMTGSSNYLGAAKRVLEAYFQLA